MNPLETLMRLWQGTLGPAAPQQLNPYQAQDKELETLMLAANQPTALPISPAGLVPQAKSGNFLENLPFESSIQFTEPQNLPAKRWAEPAISQTIRPFRQELLPVTPRSPGPLTKEQLLMLLSGKWGRG